jgi:hypothetical protein
MSKMSKENPKEEEKAVLQSNLSGFFNMSTLPQSKFQGSAKYSDFPT